MAYLPYYRKKEALPIILELFNKENISITLDNIKVFASERMRNNDILKGCSLHNTLIYTNKVMFKNKLSQENNVKIYDIEDVMLLAVKHSKFEIFDMLK